MLLASSPAPSSQDARGLRKFLDAQSHANAQLLNQGVEGKQGFMRYVFGQTTATPSNCLTLTGLYVCLATRSLSDTSEPAGDTQRESRLPPYEDKEEGETDLGGWEAPSEGGEQALLPSKQQQLLLPLDTGGGESGGQDASEATGGSSSEEAITVGASLEPSAGGGVGVPGLSEGVLVCSEGGGRPQQRYKGGIVYWKQWGEQAEGWQPLFAPPPDGQARYVTFEPDEGGFNNVRASLEVMVVFALVTGRTLVVPDPYPMYLLGEKGERETQAGEEEDGPGRHSSPCGGCCCCASMCLLEQASCTTSRTSST